VANFQTARLPQSVVRITRSHQDEEGFSDSSDDEKGGKGSKGSKDGALWIGSEIAWSMLESTILWGNSSFELLN
jgi:hypothetical protein